MIPIAKVIVSSTEPQGKNRKKVWMQKGKNILDKKMLIRNRGLNTDNGSVSILTSGNYYGTEKYIPFSQYANKQISISTRMSIAFYDSTKQFISSIVTTQTNSVIVPSNTSFMRCDVYKDNYNEAQIEQGPNATDYEAYIEPKIYIKNSNDVYEEFIKKDEVEEVEITSLINGATLNDGWQNKLFRMGNLCHLELGFVPNTTNDIAIYQIPARFVPRMSTIGLLMRNNLIGKSIITTSNNGQIKIQVPSNADVTWELNATWFI